MRHRFLILWLGDMLFGQYIPQLTVANAQVAIWKTLLASLYGGIVEELLLRLFVMSLIAWIIAKIAKSIEPAKNSVMFCSRFFRRLSDFYLCYCLNIK